MPTRVDECRKSDAREPGNSLSRVPRQLWARTTTARYEPAGGKVGKATPPTACL